MLNVFKPKKVSLEKKYLDSGSSRIVMGGNLFYQQNAPYVSNCCKIMGWRIGGAAEWMFFYGDWCSFLGSVLLGTLNYTRWIERALASFNWEGV